MAEEMKMEELEKCGSEEELYQLLSKASLPEGEELSESDLELVVGGMSKSKAVKVVSKAYWDLCVKGKKSTKYSASEIQEALKICDGMNSNLNKICKDILKWGIPKLMGL